MEIMSTVKLPFLPQKSSREILNTERVLFSLINAAKLKGNEGAVSTFVTPLNFNLGGFIDQRPLLLMSTSP